MTPIMQPTDPNHFAEEAWKAIVRTIDVAKQFRHQQLETEHLMKALLEPQSYTVQVFTRLGVSIPQLQNRTEEFIYRHPKIAGDNQHLYLGRSLDALLDRAEEHRRQSEEAVISVEHLLLAYAGDDRFGKLLFAEFKLQEEGLKTVVDELRSTYRTFNGGALNALKLYGHDLTSYAAQGKLTPLIGRHFELRRLMGILSRFSSNGPLLIGEPGVGKTAIVHGLAQRIIREDVPPVLRNSRLISLNASTLIAGATTPDEVRLRFASILSEAGSTSEQVVLFLDEIHALFDPSLLQSGMGLDAVLDHNLTHGNLRCIATTTPDKFHACVDRFEVLKRHFQPVVVNEPTTEETISILRCLKERYEIHHGVRIADSALVAAATVSARHISNRCLPERAIDLVDEAAARLKMEITSKPESLDEVERKILQLEMDRLSLQTEVAGDARNRLERIEQELEVLRIKHGALNTRWQAEKEVITQILQLKEELDRVNSQIQQAEREFNLNRAADLKYGKLPELTREIQNVEARLAQLQSEGTFLLQKEVTEVNIAELVSNLSVQQRSLKPAAENSNQLEQSAQERITQLEAQLRSLGVEPEPLP